MSIQIKKNRIPKEIRFFFYYFIWKRRQKIKKRSYDSIKKSNKKKNLKRFIEISSDFSINYDIGVCVIELSDITGNNLFKLIEADNISTRINQFNFIFGEFTNEKSILNFIDFIEIGLKFWSIIYILIIKLICESVAYFYK